MGVWNNPGIFLEKMNLLFNALICVRAYIDDLLIISEKTQWV